LGENSLSIDEDGAFNQLISWNEGVEDYEIVVQSWDNPGNKSSAKVNIKRLIDTSPPDISEILINQTSGEKGTIFVITASITDDSGVNTNTVNAYIQFPDETNLYTLPMYDNGSNGDSQAGDDIYTCQWDSSDADENTFSVDIKAEDNESNDREVENVKNIIVYDVPSITNITHAPTEPTNLDSVTVTATIVDSSGVASALVYYSHSIEQSEISIAMSKTSEDNWQAEIPSQSAGDITYKIVATDIFTRSNTSEDFQYTVIDTQNHPPTCQASDITGQDANIYAGKSYSVTSKYSDEDGYANLNELYLRLDNGDSDILFKAQAGESESDIPITPVEGSSFVTSASYDRVL
jgi:hypothetical protein